MRDSNRWWRESVTTEENHVNHVLPFPQIHTGQEARSARRDFWVMGVYVAGLICILCSVGLLAGGVAYWWVFLALGTLLVLAKAE